MVFLILITNKLKMEIGKTFPGLADLALQKEIIEVSTPMHFKAGQTLLDYGEYVKFVPLVVSGSIKVLREDEDGHEILLYYLNEGETCAMSFTCCMMNRKSEIKTVAEEDIDILAIPLKYIDLWISKYTSWKNFIMLSYNARLEELLKALDSIAFKKMDERLLEYLKKKAEANGSPSIHSTHQEIAYELNASREAISRLLKKLENNGVLKLGRNKITLIS